MQLFDYRAVDALGRITAGQLPALSLRELESRLHSSGQELIKAKAVSGAHWWPGAAIPIKELINFCFHMDQTLKAGILVTDALSDVIDGTSNHRFRDTLLMVLESVRGGQPLSDALGEFPHIFDEVFIGLVNAGEQSGRLAEMFAKLGDSLRWQDELSSQVKKLLMYPAFMFTVLFAVTLFVLLYLVPQLSGFIKSMGGALPFQTRLLLGISEFLVAHWGKSILFILTLPLVLWITLKASGSRLDYQIDRLKLKIPLFGKVIEKSIVARFASLFGMLYESGIPVLKSIDVCRKSMGNKALERAVEIIQREINAGNSVAQSFETAKLFPSLMVRMIKIGESTGEIDKALINVSYFFNREVKETIAKVQAMIEPMITLILGVILGWLMMAVLGPVYDLIAKIKV
jgi:type IV pilus assembly protein PilC